MTKETFDYFLNRENIYDAYYDNDPEPFESCTDIIYNIFKKSFKWILTPQGFDFWNNIDQKWQEFYDKLLNTPEYKTVINYNLIAIFPKDAADQDIKQYLQRNDIKIDHADKSYVYELSTTFTYKK